jgi:hypothetical protein
MRRRSIVAAAAVVLAVAFGAVSAGCFGSFKLTKQLYEVNKSVEEKYLRSAVTWLLIVPYAFTGTLDFLIFNVVEFWSGQSPIASGPVTVEYADAGGRTVLLLARDGAATLATVERREGGIPISTLRIRDDGTGTVTAVERAGSRVAREVTAVPCGDGSVEVIVSAPGGTTRERVGAAAVQAAMARIAGFASESRFASHGPAGHLPLAAARIPAHGG